MYNVSSCAEWKFVCLSQDDDGSDGEYSEPDTRWILRKLIQVVVFSFFTLACMRVFLYVVYVIF